MVLPIYNNSSFCNAVYLCFLNNELETLIDPPPYEFGCYLKRGGGAERISKRKLLVF